MAGGLIQLVAYGIQDIYLTGDPQITFFKVIYRRHTNFSIESIVQNFNTIANFGEKVTCTISKSGDLIGRIFLYVEIPVIPKFIDKLTNEEDNIKKMAWVKNLGYALIDEVYIEINDKIIDKQYGEWMYLWSQFTKKQDYSLNKMIGNVPQLYEFSNGKAGYQLYIPLEFWFCRNIGLALPLISLYSSDIKLTITFRKLEECYRIGPTHSIEIIENIVPFKFGDYIEQTINNQKIGGFFIGFDYLDKKIYYIKISNCSNINFESFQENFNNLRKFERFLNLDNKSIPKDIINSVYFSSNIPYRIYNSITNSYVTPKANSKEFIVQTNFPYKPQFNNSYLYVDYVYLDINERNNFIKTNLEYLIEQIQINQEIGINNYNIKQKLTFNHPIKAIYWVAQLDSIIGQGKINDLFNYTTSYINNQNYGDNLIKQGKLILNGKDRFGTRNSILFNFIEPYQHHYRGPNIGINMYSFSIYPEQYQPSSTINMSKIDDASLILQFNNNINFPNTLKLRTYAINYNILRICFGLGNIAFS